MKAQGGESEAINVDKEEDEQQQEAPKKILIIGGGIAGLTLALAIEKLAQVTGLPLQPIIFEKSENPYSEKGPHYLLWRWAVEGLIELGLGHKLGRLSWPILMCKSIDADSKEPLLQYPPKNDISRSSSTSSFSSSRKAGSSDNLKQQADNESSAIPFMIGTRKSDIIRLLMLGLAGKEDVEMGNNEFSATGANNSDIATQATESFDADLAKGNWFEKEKWRRLLPDLRLGYELESYMISASTGAITASFKNGLSETGDMLIGADGYASKVRDFLTNARVPAQFANTAIINGITRIHVPPVDTPTELEDGRLIEDMTRDDLYTFCPDGSAVSLVGGGVSFGVTNIGNGMLGWNLVSTQNEPGQHVEKVVLTKKRNELSNRLRNNPRSSIIMQTPPPSFGTDLPPSGSIFEQQRKARHSTPIPMKSFDPTMFQDPLTQQELSGSEIRNLALRLSLPLTLPHPCHAIIARTDPDLVEISDVMDVADSQPESYSSPNFHPGRIILIGDAAHPIACDALGSIGAGLAITDSILLSKLIAKHHLQKNQTGTRTLQQVYKNIACDFDLARLGIGNSVVKEARSQGNWDMTGNGWVRSLMRMGKKLAPSFATRASFERMLSRGGVEDDGSLPGFSKIN